MTCIVCHLEGKIIRDYNNIQEGTLCEITEFRNTLKNRQIDSMMVGIIFNQLGSRFDLAHGYICSTCRIKINNVITQFYKPLKQLTDKEFKQAR